VPLESHRGYHVTFKGAKAPVTRSVVLTDRRIFATPMEEGFRVGGMLELGGVDRPPNYDHSKRLARLARETFGHTLDTEQSFWMGHRPCLPDSVPRIGPVDGRPGMWLAIGHGHLGLTGSINTALRLAPQVLA
jgi:D-amino-acid dehydrogenase